MVWGRELIRLRRMPSRVITGIASPLLYLFVLGAGMKNLVSQPEAYAGTAQASFNYQQYLFPGIMSMAIITSSLFSAMSIVWDREFGFLREMLVAPVRRGALVTGKALGGATTATIQGCIILAMAGAVGIPYNPLLIVVLLGEMLLLSFTMTAVGMVMAVRVKQIQSVMGLMQMITMPLLFLSGALFPAHPTLQNFKIVFGQNHYFLSNFWQQFWNSAVIAFATGVLTLLIATAAAFGSDAATIGRPTTR